MAQTAAQRLIARTGKTAADFRSNSALGEIFRKVGVRDTPELQRIKHLPRRDWTEISRDGYDELLSAHLRAPGGTMTLRPSQVALLTEACDLGGCLGQLGLGVGKTLITAVLPTLLGAERPVLLAPAKLRDKTKRDFDKLRKHWIIHPRIEFVSYQQLSRKKQADLLEELDPDLLMCDEVHALKNLKSGRTRRVARRMSARPDTMFVGLSGTLTVRTPMDYWHLLLWALLRKGLMPLPKNADEVQEWALAIGVGVDDDKRVLPGALLDLPLPEGLDPALPEITKARFAVRKRLRETPGFVMTEDTDVDASISLELICPPPSDVVNKALMDVRITNTSPNGDILLRPVDVWRQARQLACGFYYRWTPEAPSEWLFWRCNWGRYVRHVLGYSNKLDTPEQVLHWVEKCVKEQQRQDKFRLHDPAKPDDPDTGIDMLPSQILAEWQRWRPTFKPNPKAYWIDDSHMRWLMQTYCTDKEDPTLIWVEHVAVGELLAELTGFPYCHEGGRDQKGRYIEDLSGQHVICSVESCNEGMNLQAWHRNLVVSCPPSGKTWEQMIGRTHRSGQLADEVEVLVFRSCIEQEEGLDEATKQAEYAFETFGQKQRLMLADRV